MNLTNNSEGTRGLSSYIPIYRGESSDGDVARMRYIHYSKWSVIEAYVTQKCTLAESFGGGGDIEGGFD